MNPASPSNPIILRLRQLPFDPKPEHPEWIHHKLHDESWEQWRKENPEETGKLSEQLNMPT